MRKLIILATAGFFLLSLQGARAQKEVAPPAVPPMLEGQRPLVTPDAKEPAAPKKVEDEKVKPATKAKGKSKAGKADKSKKTAKLCKNGKKSTKVAKNKGQSQKTTKKKRPAAAPAPAGPDEG